MGRPAKHPSGPTVSKRVRASPAFFDWLKACQETWDLSQADTLERVMEEMEALRIRHPPRADVERHLKPAVAVEADRLCDEHPVDLAGDDLEHLARS
jgi:hypothetical protein